MKQTSVFPASTLAQPGVKVHRRTTPVSNTDALVSNKGFLPMTRDQYLALLDTFGRVVRTGKRAFIPNAMPPILQRVNVDPNDWLDSLLELFQGRPHPRP